MNALTNILNTARDTTEAANLPASTQAPAVARDAAALDLTPEYLPSGYSLQSDGVYSPDLNPIEQAYSKLRAHLRRVGARSFTEVFEAIGAICDLYDPAECWNYFNAAGYVSG